MFSGTREKLHGIKEGMTVKKSTGFLFGCVENVLKVMVMVTVCKYTRKPLHYTFEMDELYVI